MDDLNKVSNNMKKKLTLRDYPSHNSELSVETKTEEHGQHASMTASQQESVQPAYKADNAKIKVTYYLTPEDNQRLTDIYIKTLQLGKKVDKSSLIAAAIRLLAKKYNI